MNRYMVTLVVTTIVGTLSVTSESKAEDLQCKSDCYEALRGCIAATPGGSAAGNDRHRARCEDRARTCLNRCE
jgi:hypothetical protein